MILWKMQDSFTVVQLRSKCQFEGNDQTSVFLKKKDAVQLQQAGRPWLGLVPWLVAVVLASCRTVPQVPPTAAPQRFLPLVIPVTDASEVSAMATELPFSAALGPEILSGPLHKSSSERSLT